MGKIDIPSTYKHYRYVFLPDSPHLNQIFKSVEMALADVELFLKEPDLALTDLPKEERFTAVMAVLFADFVEKGLVLAVENDLESGLDLRAFFQASLVNWAESAHKKNDEITLKLISLADENFDGSFMRRLLDLRPDQVQENLSEPEQHYLNVLGAMIVGGNTLISRLEQLDMKEAVNTSGVTRSVMGLMRNHISETVLSDSVKLKNDGTGETVFLEPFWLAYTSGLINFFKPLQRALEALSRLTRGRIFKEYFVLKISETLDKDRIGCPVRYSKSIGQAVNLLVTREQRRVNYKE